MKFGLTEETIDKIKSVFAKYLEIEKVIIYGSRAKGNYRPGSDIDLTLSGQSITDAIISKVYSEIDGLNTPYLFDISIYQKLHAPELEEHIKRAGQLFYIRQTTNESSE